MSNPQLTDAEREDLVHDLMDARRAVRSAKRAGDRIGESAARAGVDLAKRKLGERGPVWWIDGSPDYNRHLVHTTPYAKWYELILQDAEEQQE
jgi:phosphate uptake regulator